MAVISVWDNENSRWKSNTKKNNSIKKAVKDKEEQGGTQDRVNKWGLNDLLCI